MKYRRSHWDDYTNVQLELGATLEPKTRLCSITLTTGDIEPFHMNTPRVLSCDVLALLEAFNRGDRLSALEVVDWSLDESEDVVHLHLVNKNGAVEVQGVFPAFVKPLCVMSTSYLSDFLQTTHEIFTWEMKMG